MQPSTPGARPGRRVHRVPAKARGSGHESGQRDQCPEGGGDEGGGGVGAGADVRAETDGHQHPPTRESERGHGTSSWALSRADSSCTVLRPRAPPRLPILLLSVLAVRTALAYVPAPGAIFRHLLTEGTSSASATLAWTGTLLLSGSASSDAGRTGRSTIRCSGLSQAPGRCRLETSGPETGKLAVVQSGGQLKNEGPSVAALGVGLGEVCALFGARSAGDGRAQLEAHLRKRGVNTGASWLARFGGHGGLRGRRPEGRRRSVLGIQGQLAPRAHALEPRAGPSGTCASWTTPRRPGTGSPGWSRSRATASDRPASPPSPATRGRTSRTALF
jgi:hypothetical protein